MVAHRGHRLAKRNASRRQPLSNYHQAQRLQSRGRAALGQAGCTASTPYNPSNWRVSQEIAATNDAVQYLAPAIVPGSDDTLQEVHRLLQEGHGVNGAAESLSLVIDLEKSCPSTSKTFVKDLLPKMRDVFVLRCLCQIDPRGYGDRASFLSSRHPTGDVHCHVSDGFLA